MRVFALRALTRRCGDQRVFAAPLALARSWCDRASRSLRGIASRARARAGSRGTHVTSRIWISRTRRSHRTSIARSTHAHARSHALAPGSTAHRFGALALRSRAHRNLAPARLAPRTAVAGTSRTSFTHRTSWHRQINIKQTRAHTLRARCALIVGSAHALRFAAPRILRSHSLRITHAHLTALFAHSCVAPPHARACSACLRVIDRVDRWGAACAPRAAPSLICARYARDLATCCNAPQHAAHLAHRARIIAHRIAALPCAHHHCAPRHRVAAHARAACTRAISSCGSTS